MKVVSALTSGSEGKFVCCSLLYPIFLSINGGDADDGLTQTGPIARKASQCVLVRVYKIDEHSASRQSSVYAEHYFEVISNLMSHE